MSFTRNRWTVAIARRVTTYASLSAILASPASAQRVGKAESLDGTWRGASLCTAAGRPGCHDETVIYHLRTLPSASQSSKTPSVEQRASLEWVMNKLVDGREEEMGTLTCSVDPPGRAVVCPMRDWQWTFHATRDSLRGTLANPSGVTWRNVQVMRVGPDQASRHPDRVP